jgi:hypothetical protein
MEVLKFNEAPNLLSESNNYARTLRTIGQDLTELYPEQLEIQVSGAEFIATGIGVTHPAQDQAKWGNTVQAAWNRLSGKEPGHSGSAASLQRQRFTRKYTLDDINRLEESRIPARTDPNGKPDIYSLGERLRTVGRIVESCHGTLLRIVKENNSVIFEYRDKDGIDHKEEYSNLALYKYQQRYYAERGTHTFIDPWDNKS